MGIQPYLAMTPAEILYATELPPRICWMACHFSLFGRGLSNMPQALPKGTILVLDDSIPISDHDPDLVAHQLAELAEKFDCDGVLLDFQRKNVPWAAKIGKAVVDRVQCAVGISSCYAKALDCAVLLPPILPHILPSEQFAPWQGREIWLELGLGASLITVTAEKSECGLLNELVPAEPCHFNKELFCHYNINMESDRIQFRLWRTMEDIKQLLSAAQPYGITHAVGLYQEIGKNED